ncbi:hypothetical protein VC83_02279 [Pseudogymnoascus destructans]|uniref:Uncharacterized protein n=1 Tax=Pseudogymnoascus destructans TaxID=655981 RepID=A0A177AIQ0_9PEZI|nr:uncharacterized protein VC83_02279 [Pseudogymnoascus destructans]OAF61054.1 hypothetical protein VC83_02279 [Pseudogymnoascus destructans]
MKAELQAQKLAAKEARVARQALNQARNRLLRAGIKARKEERARKKMITQFHREGIPIPPELEEPIPD